MLQRYLPINHHIGRSILYLLHQNMSFQSGFEVSGTFAEPWSPMFMNDETDAGATQSSFPRVRNSYSAALIHNPSVGLVTLQQDEG